MAATDYEPDGSRVTMLGAVVGEAGVILRIEAATALVAAVLAYRALGGDWGVFAILFLAPDLSMLGYFVNRRIGAFGYNLGHSYLSPAVVVLTGFLLHRHESYLLAAIWFAHIGFDRLLGYGLKYPHAFGATHLGWRGGRPRSG